MSNEFEEKTVDTEKIFQGKIIDVKVDTVRLPDGNQSKREIVTHPGAVAIVAVTEEGKLVMVEQYRKPLEKSLIEIPAGKLEPGEEPETTAIRELEEETGYSAEKMELINSFYTSPGFADEIVYIYKADGLTKIEDSILGDEDEFVSLKEVTVEEAIEMEKTHRIHDAKTSYALLYVRHFLLEE